jgi:hypothetical protein
MIRFPLVTASYMVSERPGSEGRETASWWRPASLPASLGDCFVVSLLAMTFAITDCVTKITVTNRVKPDV